MICVDSSVAAKLVLNEIFSEETRLLLGAKVVQEERLVAPHLLPFELANIFRQQVRRGEMDTERSDHLLERLLKFPFELESYGSIYRDALALATDFALPAAYDAHYIVLARHLHCDLLTDDRRLLSVLAGRLPFVRWIGSYGDGDAGGASEH